MTMTYDGTEHRAHVQANAVPPMESTGTSPPRLHLFDSLHPAAVPYMLDGLEAMLEQALTHEAGLSPNCRQALDYAARGWHVFPVSAAAGDPNAEPGSPKHAAYKASKAPHPSARRRVGQGPDRPEKVLKGKDAATTDPDLIRRWWSTAPNARIGLNLAASGLVAVDDDSYKAEDDQRHELRPLPHGLPETLTSRSPSGGTHRLYRAPANAATRNYRDGEVLWNRYIVLPSPGSGYRWLDPEDVPVELPEDVAADLFGAAREHVSRDYVLPDDEELAQRQAELVWYLDSLGLDYRLRDRADGQVIAELAECPFDVHSEPYKAVVGRASGGGWFAKCVKAGCGGENGASRWTEFRERYAEFPLPSFLDVAEALGWQVLAAGVAVEVPSAELGLEGAGVVLVMAESLEALETMLADVPRALGKRWVRGGSVKAEPVRWLWKNRVAVGRLNALAGDGGDGKTFASLALAVAACGGPKPPGFADDIEPGTVIYLSAEDSAAVLVERAVRMGLPDPDDLIVLNPEEGAITLRDIEELDQAVRTLGNVRLIVLDPLLSFLGGNADIYRDNEVRAVMDPLRLLAEQHEVPVLYLIHLTKSDRGAADRVMGSVAFKNLPRSVLMTGGLPTGGQAIVRAKGNLGAEPPAVEYRIEDRDGPGTDTGMLVWGRERPEIRAANLAVGGQSSRSEPKDDSELGRAMAFLRRHMALGEWYPQKELQDLAGREDISARTLKTAKQRLGIESARRGGNPGPWSWCRTEDWEAVA